MKKLFTVLTLFLIAALSIHAQFDSAPAFPGAEGHGRYVTGGRGGKVIHVTNLNDSGTGSLRAAVNGSTKKIIVFDVAGVIALKSDLKIGENTTILGQTAPSPGITIRYYTIRPQGNTIIRFIRIRRGQERDVNEGADALWQREVNSLILDHCSFSWSIDEVASFYDNNNFTMQWCTIGEALVNAGHGKGAHGYGGIWGGKLASFHHNLLIHLDNRVPRFNGARYNWDGYTQNREYNKYKWENAVQSEIVDFRNCVMYNWGSGNGCYGGPGGGYINIVNNYYKAGPATNAKTRVTQISKGESGNSTPAEMNDVTSLYYINGNYVTAASSPANYDWSGVKFDQTSYKSGSDYYTPDKANYYGSSVPHVTINSTSCVKIKQDKPCPIGDVTTHTAQKAYDKVLSYAGASLYRDDVDARYEKETRNNQPTYTGSVTKKPGLVDVVSDVKGYTEANFGTGSRPSDFDTDNDGIPDTWEKENGLNPADATDALTYTLDPKGYYTNVEVYANSLVEGIVKAERADAESTFEEYFPAIKSEIVTPGEGGNEGGNEDGGDSDLVAQTYFTMTPSVSATADLSNGQTLEGSEFATVTGGKVMYQNNNTTAYKAVTASKFYIGTSSCYFKIDLDTPLQTGDIITFYDMAATSNGLNGVYIGTSSTDKTYQTTTDVFGTVPFTVPEGLNGVSTIYINRVQGKGTSFSKMTIDHMVSANSILDIKTETNTPSYNISGQRVSSTFKGIVIKNGKKYIIK